MGPTGGSYTMAGPTGVPMTGYNRETRVVQEHEHVCPICRAQIGTARMAWMAWLGMFTAHILTEHSDVVMVTR